MQGIGRRACMLALGAALARPAQAQAPEWRIGALFPLTGASGLLGDESFRGVELAIEERNAAGGLLGRAIRLLRADAADDIAATAEARRLTQGPDRVVAIFGSLSSAVALPASQVADLAGVPYFELGARGDAVVDRGFRGVFRAAPHSADYAATALDAVVELLAPAFGVAPAALKLGIAQEEAEGANSVATAQEAAIRARGLTLADRAAYSARPADLAGLVNRLRGLGAEVVLHTGAPGDEALLFRAFRDSGWRPRMVIGTAGGYGLADTARGIGDDFMGAMSADLTPFWVNERVAPGAPAFGETYLRRFGAEPRSGHSLSAFAGARIFLDALARAGGFERDRVRSAVLATDVAEGTTPASWGARFDERGQNQRARPVLCQWHPAPGGGLRQMVIAPPAAALADPLTRLGA